MSLKRMSVSIAVKQLECYASECIHLIKVGLGKKTRYVFFIQEGYTDMKDRQQLHRTVPSGGVGGSDGKEDKM